MNTHFRLYHLKNTIILFGFNSSIFGHKTKVNFWITNEISYKIDTHIEYLKLKFEIGTFRQASVIFVNASTINVSYIFNKLE